MTTQYAVRVPTPTGPTEYVVEPLPPYITEAQAREWVPLAGPGAQLLSRTLTEWEPVDSRDE